MSLPWITASLTRFVDRGLDFVPAQGDSSESGVTLDFESEDDLRTPLGNGQRISTPPEFGRLVRSGTGFVAMAAGSSHCAALRSDGGRCAARTRADSRADNGGSS